ncbi:MAG: HNH endonuclease [Proteobacteria bacterium]|nr:HNH endonuclease [Pseudomonadota bacterium]
MIRLTKNPQPKILADNAANWTTALTDKHARGEEPTNAEKTKYRHPQVKAALVNETSGKCAYCESKLLHIHHGDVEHIYPKSLAMEKTFEWENLTLACERCNQNKSDNDPLIESIIDPYNIDPAVHLVFMGSLIFDLGTPHGISTTEMLDLNRGELVERRKEQLEKIMGIYRTLLRTDIPLAARRAIYKNLLANEGDKNAPYTAMALQAIDQMANKIPMEVTS